MTITVNAGWFLSAPGHEPAQRDCEVVLSAAGAAVRGVGKGGPILVVPAPANAHDHGYGVRTLDFGLFDDALEPWIAGLRQRPRTDPYLEALVAFGRLAANGCGGTMHCHNSLNLERLVDEAGEVVRAARKVGIRLALSCPLLDRDPWAYGGPERLRRYLTDADWQALSPKIPRTPPILAQLAAVEAVAEAHAGEMVDVQYGPIGPQWCSEALLERIAEASARTGRRIHMHLLESPRQRRWLDERFPGGVVAFLDRIGFLSPRLAVAHGVQLRPDECALLAERGVTVVTNPAANLRLCSGVAPLAAFRSAGLAFAVGLDGTAFDDDQDLWRELRLLWLLHGGRGLHRQLPAAAVFDAGTTTAAAVLNQPAGRDFALIDYGRLTEDAIFDDGDEAEMLLARMNGRYLSGLVVAGEWVVRGGRLVTLDLADARRELRAQAQADRPRLRDERRTARALAAAIRRYYGDWI